MCVDDPGQEVFLVRWIRAPAAWRCSEDGDKDGVYPAALDTFSNMGRVIDSLFLRSQKIMA